MKSSCYVKSKWIHPAVNMTVWSRFYLNSLVKTKDKVTSDWHCSSRSQAATKKKVCVCLSVSFGELLLTYYISEACLKATLITGSEQWTKGQTHTRQSQHVTKPVYSLRTQHHHTWSIQVPHADTQTTLSADFANHQLSFDPISAKKRSPTGEKPAWLHMENQTETIISQQLVSTYQYEGETMFKAVMCILGPTQRLTLMSSGQTTDLSFFPKHATLARHHSHKHTHTQ